MDRYVSLKFQGVKSAGISAEQIVKLDIDACTYLVNRQTEREVAQGMETFIKRYKQMSTRGNSANAALGSSLHRFGWVFGGTIRSTQGGFLRRGRQIPVNARAAGRRRGNLSRGKGKITPGRPKGIKRAFYPATYTLTARKPAKGKRVHSLSANIASGNQNAGKW